MSTEIISVPPISTKTPISEPQYTPQEIEARENEDAERQEVLRHQQALTRAGTPILYRRCTY